MRSHTFFSKKKEKCRRESMKSKGVLSLQNVDSLSEEQKLTRREQVRQRVKLHRLRKKNENSASQHVSGCSQPIETQNHILITVPASQDIYPDGNLELRDVIIEPQLEMEDQEHSNFSNLPNFKILDQIADEFEGHSEVSDTSVGTPSVTTHSNLSAEQNYLMIPSSLVSQDHVLSCSLVEGSENHIPATENISEQNDRHHEEHIQCLDVGCNGSSSLLQFQLNNEQEHPINENNNAAELLVRKTTKELNHARYQRRILEGKIKRIRDLAPEKQLILREKNLSSVQKYRDKEHKKKLETKLTSIQKQNDPEETMSIEMLNHAAVIPCEPLTECSALSPLPKSNEQVVHKTSVKSRQKLQAEKKMKKERNALKLKLKTLEEKNKKIERDKQKYRKRLQRLQASLNKRSSSPKSIVESMTGSKALPHTIKEKLIEGEALKQQLNESYKSITSYRKKQSFRGFIKTDILKRCKIATKCKTFKPYRKEGKDPRDFLKASKQREITKKITLFLEKEENSRYSAEKKDWITRNKIKKQKRFLNKTLQRLHTDFKSEMIECPISYAQFCKLKPFWFVQPKASNRETCLCTQHENMRLLIQRLHSLKIITENSPEKVLDAMVCNEKSESCLMGNCPDCQDKKINFSEGIDKEEQVTYKQWIKRTEERINYKTKKSIHVVINVKEEIPTTKGFLMDQLENKLPDFMQHVNNIYHQYKAIKELKESLTERDLLVHIDFAENYACKYTDEIQPVHFGASRNQVCLHTVMIYFSDKKQGCCTMSENLRHDAIAVLAHLLPILRKYLGEISTICNLHFLSDSPSAQYRNKTIFGFLVHALPNFFPQLKNITWNYSESGHGKGAVDGIGAALKSKGDTLVAHNQDIHNFPSFEKAMKENIKNVFLEVVTDEDINAIEHHCFLNQNSYRGTMNIHQVTWSREKHPRKLFFNTLSCFKCQPGLKCLHFSHGEQSINPPVADQANESTDVLEEISVGDKAENNTSTTNSDARNLVGESSLPMEPNGWVSVVYEGMWFPGKIERVTKCFVFIKYLERVPFSQDLFQWPAEESKIYKIRKSSVQLVLKEAPIEEPEGKFKFKCTEYLNSLMDSN